MKSLTKEQLLSLLSVAKKDSERNWLMLALTFNHGLRVSETLSLTPQKCRDGFLSVSRLKGSLHTTQPLVASADLLLDEKSAVEGLACLQTIRLFPITRQAVHKMFRKYCAQVGIPSHLAHIHTLKHTCGMLAIKKAGIENVRQYLGHKSIASTGMYLRVDDQAASQAVQSAL